MKMANSGNRGFTLAETAVASAVVAIIMISVVMGSNILQRTFAGSDGSLKAGADQSRVLDYIARDVHQALTASVTNSGETLTVTIPAYLDPTTGLPVIPGITSSQVNYGSAASTVTYFPSNGPATYTYQTGGRYLIRQVCLNGVACAPGASGTGITQTVISLDCRNLQINFTAPSANPDPYPNQVNVQTKITYAPRFNFDAATSTRVTNARAGTALYATAISKNPKR